MRITALVASHNRRERTLAALETFFAQRLPDEVTLDAVLVDDGSSDGTADAVREAFRAVRVIPGTGSLYWAAAMALAEQHAELSAPEYVLWLNDDVQLDEDAVQRLLRVTGDSTGCIVAGALRDPHSGTPTYGGVRRAGVHPLRVELVPPADRPQLVRLFHGNVLLVPREVRAALGPIDGGFAHAQADFDYALRARKAGISCVLADGTVGTCPRDGERARWRDASVSLRRRIALLLGPKGVPPRSSARYLRRHGGWFWLFWWITPYAKFAVLAARDSAAALAHRARRERQAVVGAPSPKSSTHFENS